MHSTANGVHYIWVLDVTRIFVPPIRLIYKGLKEPYFLGWSQCHEFPQATPGGPIAIPVGQASACLPFRADENQNQTDLKPVLLPIDSQYPDLRTQARFRKAFRLMGLA